MPEGGIDTDEGEKLADPARASGVAGAIANPATLDRIAAAARGLGRAVRDSSAASAEIRIGATVSETGPAAFLGDPEAKTLKMLVETLNAAGGINGEEIVEIQTKCDTGYVRSRHGTEIQPPRP